MRAQFGRRLTRSASILCISLVTTAAWAQQKETLQTLDTIDSFNATSVIEMQFHDPDRTQDFINLGLVGTSLSACALTSLDGMFCLDQGKFIKHWPKIDEPGTSINEFSCADAALGLSATNPCTTITVTLSGAVLLGGRNANSHRLIEVFAKPSSGCPTGSSALSGNLYCARELYAGTSVLVDLVTIEGEEAAAFKPCPSCAVQSGILGLKEKAVVFFPYPKPSSTTPPFEILNAQALGLIGNEKLLSVAMLQVPNGSATDSVAMVTTDNGRVLAKRTNVAGSVIQVFDIPAERELSSVQCNFATQNYGIRASSKSGRVYLTDRHFCYVKSLVPDGSPFDALVEDQTLSTTGSAGTFPPSNTTLAPGINIELTECAVNCPYLKNQEGVTAASFVGLKLNSSESDAKAFQILHMPDCRQSDNPAFLPEMKAVCDDHPDAVVDPDNVGHPAAQLLNITELLPVDVLNIINGSGILPEGLPDLLISRQYIATSRTDFLFDLFLYLTEPGVHFQGTFIAEYDVPVLEGVPETLGCVPDPDNLIAVDVMTNVSELYLSTDIDGDNLPEYADTLTNFGCINPTRTLQKGISAVPYNLAFNPDTHGPTILTQVKTVTEGNDAVFVRLAQALYEDLEFVRRELACKAVDNPSALPPIPGNVCSTLLSKWTAGKIKFDKCYGAAFTPKQSLADENCQAGITALTNYIKAIPKTTPTRDIGNRTGDLTARANILLNLIKTRVLPSMTLAGFCREEDPNPLTCPDPWQ